MKRTPTIVTALIVMLTLAACNFRFAPGPFDPDATEVTARGRSNEPQAVASGTLGAGQEELFRVTIPTDVRDDNDVIFFEVESTGAVAVRVLTGNGNVFASSATPAFFGPGNSGIELANSAFNPLGINVQVECRGPCVIDRANQAARYVQLENVSGSPIEFSFYAYGDLYQDTGEPANDQQGGAVLLTDFDSGAIEVMGDVDYYWVNFDGRVRFTTTAASALELVATRLSTGDSDTFGPGSIMAVRAGELIRVESRSGMAGSSLASIYRLEAVE